MSNLGDHGQPKFLKEFVVEDLEAGNISSDIHFDQAFENWKNGKKQALNYEVADEWGINGEVLKKSVDAYRR